MPDTRPLILAIALEAAPMGAVRLMRSAGRRSAYVTTLVVDPARDMAGYMGSCCGLRVTSYELPGAAPWGSPPGLHFRR